MPRPSAALPTLASAVAVLSIVFACAAMFYATSQSEASAAALASAAEQVKKEQSQLLAAVLELDRKITAAHSAALEAKETVEEAIKAAKEEAGAEDTAGLDAKLEEFKAKIAQELDEFDAKVKAVYDKLADTVDARKNRFLVKWHSDEGVKTSARMSGEQKAVEAYEGVGEFAKKLLMFEGSKWVVLKQYGGQQWLDLMTDDGRVQDGDGKPTKAPQKRLAVDSSG